MSSKSPYRALVEEAFAKGLRTPGAVCAYALEQGVKLNSSTAQAHVKQLREEGGLEPLKRKVERHEREAVKSAISAGYATASEITEYLKARGINIKTGTLEYYATKFREELGLPRLRRAPKARPGTLSTLIDASFERGHHDGRSVVEDIKTRHGTEVPLRVAGSRVTLLRKAAGMTPLRPERTGQSTVDEAMDQGIIRSSEIQHYAAKQHDTKLTIGAINSYKRRYRKRRGIAKGVTKREMIDEAMSKGVTRPVDIRKYVQAQYGEDLGRTTIYQQQKKRAGEQASHDD